MASNDQVALVGASDGISLLRQEIACAARSDSKVLIIGETGTGKEVTARLIHAQSSRHRLPMVTVNCAGVPETLLESELFGHMRGSFTGAYRDKPGLLELAHRGTVFLDEIGEMSLRMQSALLRFLETGEIQRIGSTRTESRVDVRIVAATNRDLPVLVAEKTFRQDLYYRLNVLRITVPPLRTRRADIPVLLQYFLQRVAQQYGIAPPVLMTEAIAHLTAYDWPGNVRELRNVVERTIARHEGGTITVQELPPDIWRSTQTPAAIAVAPPSDRADALFTRMVQHGETFWTTVYPPFVAHDLTRETLQAIIARGLERTRGNYRMLVDLFNLPPDDYKPFLSFLRKYNSQVPFQHFRAPLSVDAVPGAERANRPQPSRDRLTSPSPARFSS